MDNPQENRINVSIIVPVFNEAGSVSILYDRIKDALKTTARTHEIIFVDDGSTDNSSEVLKKIAAMDGDARVFTFQSNRGQVKALEKGFQEARGGIIVTIDGDLQNDPADIPKLISKLEEGYDLVCGWRSRRAASIFKVLKSKLGNYIFGKIANLRLHDMSCTLRAYRKDILRGFTARERHEIGFIPYLLSKRTSKITEVKVRDNKRISGKSKYGFLSTTIEVIRCYMKLNRGR